MKRERGDNPVRIAAFISIPRNASTTVREVLNLGPNRDFDCTDSHFRPWFNVGTDVRAMGLGIAQGSDGIWYAAAVGGTAP